MKNLKELREFVRRHFPQGQVEDDGFEIMIRTGLTEDRVTKQLVSADDEPQDMTVPAELPIFGRYRGD
jgi:hypothetical protein